MKFKTKLCLFSIPVFILMIVSMRQWHRSDISLYTAYPFKIEQAEDKNFEIAFYEKKKLKKISTLELALLGGLYFEKAKTEGNQEYILKAKKNADLSLARISSPNILATILLAKIHEYRHEFSTALKIVDDILQSNPYEVSALKIALTSHLALGNLEEAEQFSLKLLSVAPHVGNYTLSGIVAAAKGKDQEAEAFFSTALKKELGGQVKDSTWARAMIARFCIERNRNAEAADLLKEAMRISPESPLVYSILGELDFKKGNYSAASENFMKAFEQSKQSVFLMGYAKAKKAMGQEKTALQIFHQAELILREDLKKSIGHRLELAILLLERGLSEDVAEAVQMAEAESKLRKSSQSYFVLAKAQAAAKDWSSAEKAMKLTLSSGVKNADYLEFAQLIQKKSAQDMQRQENE